MKVPCESVTVDRMTTQPTTRQIFRDAIRRLDPAKPVAGEHESGWYVPCVARKLDIVGRLSLDTTAKLALVGSVGTGKSTELLYAQRHLNALPDVLAVYVDVPSLVRLNEDLPSRIVGAMIATSIQQLQSTEAPKSELTAIEAAVAPYLHGDWSFLRALSVGPGLEQLGRGFLPGVLIPPLPLPEWAINAVSEIRSLAIRSLGKELVCLFDGLDRLPKNLDFVDAFTPVSQLCAQLGVGYCVVCPLEAAFGVKRLAFQEVAHRLESLLPVQPTDLLSFLRTLLHSRELEHLFEPDASVVLCHTSGGIIRDMIQLCRESLQLAFADGSETVRERHALQAADSLGRSMMIGVLNEELLSLRHATKVPNFTPRTSTDLNLIATKRLIEVREGLRTRYEVHPALLPFIVQEQAS